MELFFKGKEFVYNHHLTVPFRPLLPHPDKSIGNGELDDNLIIHGDNLHALKSLLPRYAGKVDCIFIDPPYNTGNESWCYSDNVNSPIMREWLSSNPVNRDDMLRHDKWCAMMWPRLKLLHELLAETGSLWMTLDDNEVHRARMMLDELFGENNFLSQMAWEKVYSPRMDASGFSKDYDSILVYAKNKDEASLSAESMIQNDKAFSYTDPETGHRARLRSLRKEGSASLRIDRENCWYPILAPDGTQIWPVKPDGTEGRWRWEESTYQAKICQKPSPILITKNNGKWEVLVKQYYKGETDKPISTLLRFIDFGHTHEATEEIKEIFQEKVFDTPKPSRLIEGIIKLSCSDDALVLDSFAGSGTTAHAVLEANRKDGGSRRFILVECEDYADTLTAERVRRVINGYSFTGKQKEELLHQKLTWTKFKKASELIHKISGLEALNSPKFDRIKKEIKDNEVIVYGEKDIAKTKPGLGGSFTFCTLGDPVDLDALLTGENLPDYEALGAWVFYTATNQTLPPTAINPAKFYLGESSQYHVWLIYKPDLDFLKSNDCALTLSRAETISKTYRDKKHLVFAPVKFVPNKTLLPLGVEFAQLPYAIYRREQA